MSVLMRSIGGLTFLTLLTLASPGSAAERTLAQPTPLPPAIAAPQDIPFPGTIALTVDARDVERGIFKVTERIPVAAPGELVLRYPEWLPGNHAPRGPIDDVAGLRVTAAGKTLAWRRDPVDAYAIRVDVPAWAGAVDLAFDYVSPVLASQGRIVMTREILRLQWNLTAFYPAGYYTRQIKVAPTMILPDGWRYGTALRGGAATGTVAFDTVDFETLVDSPVMAGRYFRMIELAPKVKLHIAADRQEELVSTDAQNAAHRRLVDQALKLFGPGHYDHYDFLVTISDRIGGIGLEHQQSSENGVAEGYFTQWNDDAPARNLLPHEYTHSWNGKYRRGADLYTPDYATPMRNSLLWLYEGQTQFWGYVLQARSGLASAEDMLGAYAMIAASMDAKPGREWRPLGDTTFDPITAARRPQPWLSWQRSEDYYNEGLLLWLDVDQKLRSITNGARSLDDFARVFFGGRPGDEGVLTYRFEDVVKTLNGIAVHDWSTFLSERVNEVRPRAPIDWITLGGYRLVYAEKPTAYWKANDKRRNQTDLSHSIGLIFDNDKTISQVIWSGPAFDAGLTVGTKLIALDGENFETGRFIERITEAAKSRRPIQLLVRRGDVYRTVTIPYYGGNRFPKLERVSKEPGGLDRLLAAK